MRKWLMRLVAPKEAAELDRWRSGWTGYRQWLAEFPDVSQSLDSLRDFAIGDTAFMADVLRDQLRKGEKMPRVPLPGSTGDDALVHANVMANLEWNLPGVCGHFEDVREAHPNWTLGQCRAAAVARWEAQKQAGIG